MIQVNHKERNSAEVYWNDAPVAMLYNMQDSVVYKMLTDGTDHVAVNPDVALQEIRAKMEGEEHEIRTG
ncbi:hypothetical protein [Alteribacillus sp. YIM 98480]|uniref:hypothetical protein n=1 Tax=Alteribacillus sp. YIM 98480 TaxID=2606599 RepID=UPI00131BCE01|nr:hypothetical protein [Alteribacillus sp. YIM 98480]